MKNKYLMFGLVAFVILLFMASPLGQMTMGQPIIDNKDDMIEFDNGFTVSGAMTSWAGTVNISVPTGAGTTQTGDAPLGRTFVPTRTMFWYQVTSESNIDDSEDWFFALHWTNATHMTWIRGDDDIACTIQVTLVEFAADAGITVAEYGDYDAPTNVSITEVTASEAFVIFSGQTSTGTSSQPSYSAVIYLLNGTHVQVENYQDGVDAWSDVWFQVVSGSPLSIQRGKNEVSNTDTTRDVAISAITTTRSMILSEARVASGVASNAHSQRSATAYFVNTTAIRFTYDTGLALRYEWWQVIEFPDYVTVQYVAETGMDVGDVTESTTVTEVADITKSVSYLSGHSGQWPMRGVVTDMADDRMGCVFSNSTLSSTTNVQIGRGNGDTWYADYIVVVIEFGSSNDAPVNDAAAACTDADDTDHLYGWYKNYTFTSNVSDANGYADIDWVNISITSNTGILLFNGTYHEDTDTFAEEDDVLDYALLQTALCIATRAGNDIDITWKIRINWVLPTTILLDLTSKVNDAAGESDSDRYDTDYQTETELDLSAYALSDGAGNVTRGDISQTDGINCTGTVIYVGSALNPPSEAVDAWITGVDSGSDLTIVSGAFNTTVDSDSSVGVDVYTFKIVAEGEGSGGTDLNHATHTKSYTADRIQIQHIVANTTLLAPSDTVGLTVGLYYDYDDTNVVDGSFSLQYASTYLILTYSSGENWTTTDTSAATATRTYNDVNGTDTTNIITVVDANSQSLEVSWDKINITLTISVGWQVITYNATITATGYYDNAGYVWNGTATLNSTWACEYNATFTTSGNRSFVVTSITNDNDTLTTFDANVVWCVWDTVTNGTAITRYWVKEVGYSYLTWGSVSTWKWEQNGTFVTNDYVLHAYSNTSTPEATGGIYGSGNFGGITLGAYDMDWYYLDLTVNCEVTIGSNAYDWEVWDSSFWVDILHTIHIDSFDLTETGDYYLVAYQSNWNNATIMIWDDLYDSGTTSADAILSGVLNTEGMYYWLKDTTVGTHSCTILINGSNAALNENHKDYSVDSSWWFYNFTYQVTADVLYITDTVYSATDSWNYLSGFASVSVTTWTAYNNDTQMATGSATAGSFQVSWAKNTTVGLYEWGVSFTDGSDTRWVNGSFEIAAATVLYIQDIVYSSTVDWNYLSGYANLDVSTWTAYNNDTQIATGSLSAGSFQVSWAMNTSVGFYEWGVSFTDGTTTRWVNGSFEIAASNDWMYVTPYLPNGEGLDLISFKLYVDSVRIYDRDWKYYSDTTGTYNITITDYFGAQVYSNATVAWARNVDTLVSLYEFSVSHMLEASFISFTLTNPAGATYSTIIHPNDVVRFMLISTNTYTYSYSGIFNATADAVPDEATYTGSVTIGTEASGIVIVSWGIDKILLHITQESGGGGLTANQEAILFSQANTMADIYTGMWILGGLMVISIIGKSSFEKPSMKVPESIKKKAPRGTPFPKGKKNPKHAGTKLTTKKDVRDKLWGKDQ